MLVMKRADLMQGLAQRCDGLRHGPEHAVDLRRVIDASNGVREAAQRLLSFGGIDGGVFERRHGVLQRSRDWSPTRCARLPSQTLRTTVIAAHLNPCSFLPPGR